MKNNVTFSIGNVAVIDKVNEKLGYLILYLIIWAVKPRISENQPNFLFTTD